jgi:hypothetical protein
MLIRHKWLGARPHDDQIWVTSYSRGWTRMDVEDVTWITSQTSDRLVLERRPSDIPKTHNRALFWWCCSFVPSGIALMIFFAAWLLPPDAPAGARVLAIGGLIFTIISTATSLSSLLKAKVRTFILDKATGELTVVIRSRTQEQVSKYALQDCQGATVEAQLKPNNVQACRYACRVVLLLNSAQIIRLTSAQLLPEAPIERTLADTINQFLRS